MPGLDACRWRSFHSIVSMVDDYPISLEEAQRTRQESKEEREEEFRKRHTNAMMELLEWGFGTLSSR